MKEPKNKNYCATVVKITNLTPLENCDNIIHTNIFGDMVIVSKDVMIEDIGLFFPVETQLSKTYLSQNNLYRDNTLNVDNTKNGFFETNGRIRTMKFRDHKSMGLYVPLTSLNFIDKNLKFMEGWEFDEVNDIKICRKYITTKKQTGTPNKQKEKTSRLIDNQFKLHYSTTQLGKSIHKIKADDMIHISYKIDGTSLVSANILCKHKFKWYEKTLNFLNFKIGNVEYANVYSSRRIIKNKYKEENNCNDIWKLANEKLKPITKPGMTLYAEIAGYVPKDINNNFSNQKQCKLVQSGYDYGCKPGEFKIFIYRITLTNSTGSVFELSAKQVNVWCKENGALPVPELFYGKAKEFLDVNANEFSTDKLLEKLKEEFLDRDCYLCKNKVPMEGIVIRVDSLNEEAFKLKNFTFLQRETKELDKGETNIEDEQ